jgi:hypothetical protein
MSCNENTTSPCLIILMMEMSKNLIEGTLGINRHLPHSQVVPPLSMMWGRRNVKKFLLVGVMHNDATRQKKLDSIWTHTRRKQCHNKKVQYLLCKLIILSIFLICYNSRGCCMFLVFTDGNSFCWCSKGL